MEWELCNYVVVDYMHKSKTIGKIIGIWEKSNNKIIVIVIGQTQEKLWCRQS